MNQTSFIGSAEILEGGVQIVQNRNLSYAPWINWRDIVRDSDARIQIQNNERRGLYIHTLIGWLLIESVRWVFVTQLCFDIHVQKMFLSFTHPHVIHPHIVVFLL